MAASLRVIDRPSASHHAAPSVAPTSGRAARDLCVVLHDVAPSRWTACQRIVEQVQRCAQQAGVPVPMTLLVVPRMHGDDALPPTYLRWLHTMHAAGHELALHGLTHRDEGPPARSLRERLLRRFYTAGEGEFAALEPAQAAARLREAQAWAQGLGLPMTGFVAPAWLMSPASLQAVAEAGFSHTCTLTEVITLPRREALRAPSLVFSTRSGWRRQLSLLWNRRLAWRARDARLLRLELHPGDVAHPAILRCWTALLQEALTQRVPLRLSEAAQLARLPRA